jgi:hypothetical protein
MGPRIIDIIYIIIDNQSIEVNNNIIIINQVNLINNIWIEFNNNILMINNKSIEYKFDWIIIITKIEFNNN